MQRKRKRKRKNGVEWSGVGEQWSGGWAVAALTRGTSPGEVSHGNRTHQLNSHMQFCCQALLLLK